MANFAYSVLSVAVTGEREVRLEKHTHPLDDAPNARDCAVSEILQGIQAMNDRPKRPDIQFAFPGHLELVLRPDDFDQALSDNPLLLTEKLQPLFGVNQHSNASGPRPFFSYRYWSEGVAETPNQMAVTLLMLNVEQSEFMLMPLMIERGNPAAACLQYLDEMTNGDARPLAALTGIVSDFLHAEQDDPESATEDSSMDQPAASSDSTRFDKFKKYAAGRKAQRRNTVNPMHQVAGVLLDQALLHQGALNPADLEVPGAGLRWLTAMLDSRAIVALETQWNFIEEMMLGAIQRDLSLSCKFVGPLGPSEATLAMERITSPSVVVLPMNAYPHVADPERIAQDILGVEHAALIACSSLRELPEPLRRIVEVSIVLPRMDRELITRLFEAQYGELPDHFLPDSNESWIGYVQPMDVVRVFRVEDDALGALNMLRQRLTDRLTRLTPQHGPSLSELHGLGDARIRAEMLIADIRAALDGQIPWSQVDRGMLLSGPPGCGKTTLARAMAKDCGIQFVECSAARWQMAGYLNEHLAAMHRDFQEARRFEPSIMFIDEIDSIGSREQFSGSNASYNTQVVNALLAEMQGFSDRGRVFVIAATNKPENVDPALRRAGRLDRVVEMGLPTMNALEKIFAYYLTKHEVDIEASDIDLRPLAEAAFGRTGADVSLAVRGAVRRARLAGRPVCQDDLLADLFHRPLDESVMRPLSGEGLRRVAVHEAGHALVRLKLYGGQGGISYLSIVPRPDGKLGFVALTPNPDTATVNRSDFMAYLVVLLAGRAAEEVYFGLEEVGAGAGGGTESDLASATAMATDMVCRLGLGQNMRLQWRQTPTAQDLQEIESLIAESYEQAKALVAEHRDVAERIVDALMAKQEMSGEELAGLIGEDLV